MHRECVGAGVRALSPECCFYRVNRPCATSGDPRFSPDGADLPVEMRTFRANNPRCRARLSAIPGTLIFGTVRESAPTGG